MEATGTASSAGTAAPQAPHRRYPGPPPFEDTPEDQAAFFGRDLESESIAQLVVASRLVLLFGKSGLGKTSLLNAGVFPRLRSQGYFPVRLRLLRGARPAELVAAALRAAAGRFATAHAVPAVETLWELLKRATFWREETLLTPVLVFDQFEEAFTVLSDEERSALAEELGALASGSMPEGVRRRQRTLPEVERLTDTAPEAKVLLALREEHLAGLQELSIAVPRLFQDRFRLLPLDEGQASEAIRRPGLLGSEAAGAVPAPFAGEPFRYDDDAVRLMLSFLRGKSGAIEPWELQILCSHVEERLVPALRRRGPGPVKVSAAALGGEGAMRRILGAFYESRIRQIPARERKAARELCDSGLVSSEGRRISLERGQIDAEYRVSGKTLERLVDARILREEPRLESNFYEISHDTLAETIFRDRPWRLPRRYRVAAAVFVPMLLCGLLYGSWSLWSIARQRNLASQARSHSERLVTFLISEDFHDELMRSGKLAGADAVQKEVEGYLEAVAGHPSLGSRTAEAWARLNAGALAYERGRLGAAAAAYQQAVQLFEALHGDAKAEASIAAGLAEALHLAGVAAADQGDSRLALERAERALQLRASLSGPLPAEDRLLRKRMESEIAVASLLERRGRIREAAKHLEAAQSAMHGRSRDPSAGREWLYLYADLHDAQGTLALRQRDSRGAAVSYRKLRQATEGLVKAAPYEPKAHYLNALALYQLAATDPGEAERLLSPGALRAAPGGGKARSVAEVQYESYRKLYAAIEKQTRWEPGSGRFRRELAAAGMWLARGKAGLGEREEARLEALRSLVAFEELAGLEPTCAQFRGDVAWARRELAEYVSDAPSRVEHLQAALRRIEGLAAHDPGDSRVALDRIGLELELAKALMQIEKREEARREFQSATDHLAAVAEVDPEDGEYYDQLISLAMERENALAGEAQVGTLAPAALKGALSATDQALRANPANTHFLAQRASILGSLGARWAQGGDLPRAAEAFEGAEGAIRRALELEGTNPALHYQSYLLQLDRIAPARAAQGDEGGTLAAYRQAEKAAAAAVALAPGEPGYRKELARAIAARGKLLEGRQPPDRPGAGREYARAERAIRAALAIRPKDADLWNTLFLHYYETVAPLWSAERGPPGALAAQRKAKEFAAKAAGLAPANSTYALNLHLAQVQVGDALRALASPDRPGAEREYAGAARALRGNGPGEPSSPSTWNRLFLLYFDHVASLREEQEDPAAVLAALRTATEQIDRAVSLDPQRLVYASNRNLAHRRLANALCQGEPPDPLAATAAYQRAEAAIQAALSLDPAGAGHADALLDTRLDAAACQKATGRKAEAARWYRSALSAARASAKAQAGDAQVRVRLVRALLGVADTAGVATPPDASEAKGARTEAIAELRSLKTGGQKLPPDLETVVAEVTAEQ